MIIIIIIIMIIIIIIIIIITIIMMVCARDAQVIHILMRIHDRPDSPLLENQ